MAGRATLYLIPTPLGQSPLSRSLPEETRRIAGGLDHFIAENAKSARAFLKQAGTHLPLQQLHIAELNEHTPPAGLPELLRPLLKGHDVGLLSEAGCPAIADPGAPLVRLAHRQGIRVKPLVGPSSLVLALMASGLIGQRFTFHGYLPANPGERGKALRELEKRSEREDAAQLFIETPYRNTAVLESLAAVCHPDTWFSVACDLTLDDEYIHCGRIVDGIKHLPDLAKRPCVFSLYRPGSAKTPVDR